MRYFLCLDVLVFLGCLGFAVAVAVGAFEPEWPRWTSALIALVALLWVKVDMVVRKE